MARVPDFPEEKVSDLQAFEIIVKLLHTFPKDDQERILKATAVLLNID